MTWDEIADEQRRAAEILLERRACPRAICSRAYYAAYALIAGRAPASTAFPLGWNNPAHGQIAGIVDQMRGVPKHRVRLAISRLRLSRVSADYGAGQSITLRDARERLRDCAIVFSEIRGR